MIEFRQTTDEQWTNIGNRMPVQAVSLSTDAVNLEEICAAFQRFLLAIGFTLPEGAHIGYEYDELTQKEGETCVTGSCRPRRGNERGKG